MIEEDIGDHARVMSMVRNQYPAEGCHGRMRIGKGVDPAVQHDSVANAWRELIAEPSLYKIARQVTDQCLRGVARQKEVSEIVHSDTISASRRKR